ncbi:hypothetical protein [Flavobacterium aciduliphilum]|uniref:Uncharacterized protein n=1 Tax=Flavobacterium aciduliphilum TaxID=1101402 RepID=A0A328YTD3_9FLAO|nr:hypothetical protein [Flavobacterium aciduliphilum]RAR73807.1 hypothetical protein CLV55_103126 [Flavobacterium aciduliphilum]
MIIKPIIEERINLADTSHLCASIIAEYKKAQQIETDDFEWVHLIYGIQGNKPVLFYIRFINGSTALPNYDLSSYQAQINKSSFNQLLYLLSYYGFFKEDEDNLSLLKVHNTSNKLGYYFENTFGKLLYHYQLEQLYCSSTQCNIEEAVNFRKAINLKSHRALEKAKTIVLPTGESLFEVITQYRHRDFTLYPKIKEAIALYNYLNP